MLIVETKENGFVLSSPLLYLRLLPALRYLQGRGLAFPVSWPQWVQSGLNMAASCPKPRQGEGILLVGLIDKHSTEE